MRAKLDEHVPVEAAELLRAYPPSEYVGIVVFRPAEPSRRHVLEMLSRVLPVLAA